MTRLIAAGVSDAHGSGPSIGAVVEWDVAL